MTGNPIRRMLCCALFALAAIPLFSACEDFTDEGNVSDDAINGRVPETTNAVLPGTSAPLSQTQNQSTDSGYPIMRDSTTSATDTYNTSSELGAIVWKGKDVSGWPETATLHASVSRDTVTLKYDKAKAWPIVNGVCANVWAIVNINGKWYAATFEYLRSGQTSKPSYTLDGSRGDHFKTAPHSNWRPQKGEAFGLMVSGLCRGNLSNVRERSNICIVHWP